MRDVEGVIGRRASGASGLNRTATCAESLKLSCPDTGAPALVRLTVPRVILAGESGSLKTIRITALSGTSRLRLDGAMRMTTGPFEPVTEMPNGAPTTAPESVMTLS